ncbi:MAG: vanadium-dependent haloperoxidase [Burkholderiales bacterium]
MNSARQPTLVMRGCIRLMLILTGAVPLAVSASVVSDWNKVALAEVRLAKQGPPVVARSLAIAHTCIYDAWASYSAKALGAVVGDTLRRPAAERNSANRTEAISYAAYACLRNLFPAGESRLRAAMATMGYNPDNLSTDTSTPAGLGNSVALAVIDSRRYDGSNQYGDLAPGAYKDYTGYVPQNLPMPFCTPQSLVCAPLIINDEYRWQPLYNEMGTLQSFIAPDWERVKPFALTSADQLDDLPGLKALPSIQRDNPARYRANVDLILKYSRELTPERKLIVEYWADGPASEFPPGHWGLFAQFVSERDNNSIGKDAKMFFAMHNASFDAGIVAWHLKRKFEGVRPITAVRFFKQGQSIVAWGGPGRPVEAIQGEKWMPYNPGSNPTPAFPGYVSGHSSFSSASATVLQLITGSDRFDFQTTIPANFGRVEPGVPAVPTVIKYKKFSDAVDDAGMSRLYGGIHFKDDNTAGQLIGKAAGRLAYDKAITLFNGSSDD